jgi:hypothetical protein
VARPPSPRSHRAMASSACPPPKGRPHHMHPASTAASSPTNWSRSLAAPSAITTQVGSARPTTDVTGRRSSGQLPSVTMARAMAPDQHTEAVSSTDHEHRHRCECRDVGKVPRAALSQDSPGADEASGPRSGCTGRDGPIQLVTAGEDLTSSQPGSMTMVPASSSAILRAAGANR